MLNFFFDDQRLRRIRKLKRYEDFEIQIADMTLKCPDNLSFAFQFEEIFRKKVYFFRNPTSDPYIIDGGANIGLSTIYWKKLYPNSIITAFEPDKKIFCFLRQNIANNQLTNVELINKALWSEETSLNFQEEGADAGRIIGCLDSGEQVSSVRLSQYLNRKVDYLKLDIEGSELEVLKEIQHCLHLVERMFIEYHSFEKEDQKLDEVLAILKGAGFRYYISTPGLSQKHPFSQVETYLGMDMQLNIYGVRQ